MPTSSARARAITPLLSQTAASRWPGGTPWESQPEGGRRFTSHPDQRPTGRYEPEPSAAGAPHTSRRFSPAMVVFYADCAADETGAWPPSDMSPLASNPSISCRPAALMRHGQIPVTDGPLGWMGRANCSGILPDLFFSDVRDLVLEAKEVCRGCVVRGQCLQYANDWQIRSGVWGGQAQDGRSHLQHASSVRVVHPSDPETLVEA